jgi:hypothetical protein
MVPALSLLVLCAVADAGGASAGSRPVAPSTPGAGVPLAVLPLRAEGLQLNEAQRLDGLIRARGATVVVMTHRTSVLGVADKMLIMRDGAQQAFGPRDEVLAALQQKAKS